MIRLGIVGCGRVTELRHLPALQRRVPGLEVVALADVDAARLERVAGAFRIARRYTDYLKLIEDERVDAVAVCVPPTLHTEVALAALDAGKHVFIEKPLALSLGECDLLSERAALAGSPRVLVGFNMRWHRLVREARGRIRRGELGRIKLVRTLFVCGIRNQPGYPVWRKRRETGGGAIYELGVHHFDLVRFLLGSEAREVYATSTEEDETAIVTTQMSGGEQVVTALSEGTGENHEFEVYGERGWLRVSCYRADGIEQLGAGRYPGAVGARLRGAGRALLNLPDMIRQARLGGDYVSTYAGEWRHFAEVCRNAAPVEATVEDGRRALEVALAALESDATKRAVKLESANVRAGARGYALI
jgi:myo-inositol 2-dehydrogenase/D-chiro-inositol 1-dehydrogenase